MRTGSVVGSGVLAVVFLAVAGGADAASPAADATTTVVCGSKAGERLSCAADTKGGVTLVKSFGIGPCELGRTWGYDGNGVWVSDGCAAEFSIAGQPGSTFGRYTPTAGFKVADTEHGDLNIRVFGYMRYLNQLGLDPTYTDAFGHTRDVQTRQDIQFNKLLIYFYGWIWTPKFRYLTYVWTSNTSLGQVSQLVAAGNVTYNFSDHLTLGVGISSLPGVRTTEGNFPFWLSVDERAIADEFFRPSYTTGLFATGQIAPRLDYQLMLGNNLSQFGIDAGQVDSGLDTLSGALIWLPTTGEFGKNSSFGDFERHDTLATRLAVHFTRSDETRQGQPTTDAFDNVQLRVSDGSVIFSPGLFAPDIQIDEARYKMLAFDGGLKYRGLSLDAEFYRRRIDDFAVLGTGLLPFERLDDTGFQLQASAMAVPEQVQIYAGGLKVFGQYGDPKDLRAGVTLFPWKNQILRWNFEFLHVTRSPVGALNMPYSVGSNGPIFHSNLMLLF